MENTTENKPAEKERKSIKVWSENLQRFYYKSKDPNYYNDYFHKQNQASDDLRDLRQDHYVSNVQPPEKQKMHYEKAGNGNRAIEKAA